MRSINNIPPLYTKYRHLLNSHIACIIEIYSLEKINSRTTDDLQMKVGATSSTNTCRRWS